MASGCQLWQDFPKGRASRHWGGDSWAGQQKDSSESPRGGITVTAPCAQATESMLRHFLESRPNVRAKRWV